MATSSSSRSNHHVRSVSLPCRSHPSIAAIEEQLLNTLKTREAPLTTERMCSDLSQLEELYRSVDELILASSLTQQALSHYQNEGCVSELLDASVSLLDICGRTRDVMSQIQENVRDVQSALRRRKGAEYTSSIAKYTSFSSKIKKDAKKLIAELKQVDNKVAPLVDLDHQVSSVIRVLRAVISLTVSIFQSFLAFLVASLSMPKPSKWSVVSKLMQKGISATPNENELESRLEILDVCINDVDSDMERVFRRLIATRASLLNIVSY